MKLQQNQRQKTSFNLVYAGAGFAALLVVGALTFFFNVGNVQDALAGKGDKEAVWEGKYSGDWNDGRNWKGGKLPSSGANVYISKYKNTPEVSKNSKFKVGELELKDGSDLIVKAELEISDELVMGEKCELTVNAPLSIKKKVSVEEKAKITLLKGSDVKFGGEVELREGSIEVEDGALAIGGDLVIGDDKSSFIQHKGKTKLNRDLHLVSSESKGELGVEIKGGVFTVSGSTRFYRESASDQMTTEFKVSGGTVNLDELSRDGGKGTTAADYNFTVSGGLLNFWDDVLMDSSGTSGSGTTTKRKYCSGLSGWSKSTTYKRDNANEIVAVTYDGYEYRLKQDYWWSKGNTPDSKGKGYWIKQGKCGSEDKAYDCKKIKNWNKNATYRRNKADNEYYVLYDGSIYRMNKTCWYTKGNQPDKTSWAWVKWSSCSGGSSSYKDKLVHSGGEIIFHKKSIRPSNFKSTNSGIVHFKDKINPVVLKGGEKYVNIVIDTNATITLTGDVEFTGDLTNNSDNKPNGSYKFKMTGTGDQTISGKEPLELETLEIDKSKGAVYVRQDIKITKKMTFSSEIGVVIGEKSGSNKKAQDAMVTFGDGATYEGDGWFEGSVAKIGDDAFVFPIGKGGQKGYLAIAAPASASTYTAEYFIVEAPDRSDVGTGLKRVSALEYWSLEKGSGGSDVDVTLYWEDGVFSQITDPSQLLVASYDGDQWQNIGNSSTTGNSSKGTIVGSVIPTNYQYLTFGTNSTSANALPVEFIKFSAERAGNEVVVDWATSTEENNDFFEVQRSADGVNFEVIGEVNGAGTTINMQTYSYTDVDAPKSQLYYRLRQVDFNQVFDYSRIASVSGEEGSEMAVSINSIYPNPFVESFNIEFDAPSQGRAQLAIMNSSGQMIYQNEIDVWAGSNTFNYNEGGYLTPGYYILTLKLGDEQLTEKIYRRD